MMNGNKEHKVYCGEKINKRSTLWSSTNTHYFVNICFSDHDWESVHTSARVRWTLQNHTPTLKQSSPTDMYMCMHTEMPAVKLDKFILILHKRKLCWSSCVVRWDICLSTTRGWRRVHCLRNALRNTAKLEIKSSTSSCGALSRKTKMRDKADQTYWCLFPRDINGMEYVVSVQEQHQPHL